MPPVLPQVSGDPIRAGQNRKAGNPGPEGSIAKLMFAQVNMDAYELCVDLLGASGLVDYDYTMRRSENLGLTGPPGSSRKMFLRARANSIEGGTSEVMRNILGERVLGLPGDVRVDKDRPWIDGARMWLPFLVATVPPYLMEPPGDEKPAVVAGLVTDRPRPGTGVGFAATLFDLIRRDARKGSRDDLGRGSLDSHICGCSKSGRRAILAP